MLHRWLLLLVFACGGCREQVQRAWTDHEIRTLRSMSLRTLPRLRPDPSNRFAEDGRAASLGKKLFNEPRLSGNGRVSCASCHDSTKFFQDGLPLGHGVATSKRRTMTIPGSAYYPYLFWDGRKDSLWAQALGPLENSAEQAGNRQDDVEVVAASYALDFEPIFGPLPRKPEAHDEATARAFADIGKAIAAYERRLKPGPSRFDVYLDAILVNDTSRQAGLSVSEISGLRVFIGKARCVTCHNGPLLTDSSFHNTGVPAPPDLPIDPGRALGARRVVADEFNCRSTYSDASDAECEELNFILADDPSLLGAFRTASLRNVAERPPYMHAGQFTTLAGVIDHYNRPRPAPIGNNELLPLYLSASETADLESFLKTLTGGVIEEL